MDQTLEFYENNAAEFIARTIGADMRAVHNRFLSYVKRNGLILDLGCGSGRDSKAFLDRGYLVEAVDGAAAFCSAAAELIGQPVRQLLFENLDYNNEFDAVWACASLLHIPASSIAEILQKILKALKQNGILYLSMKQGTFEGLRNGRYFTDYTRETLCRALAASGFKILEYWTSADVRPQREGDFINVISMA